MEGGAGVGAERLAGASAADAAVAGGEKGGATVAAVVNEWVEAEVEVGVFAEGHEGEVVGVIVAGVAVDVVDAVEGGEGVAQELLGEEAVEEPELAGAADLDIAVRGNSAATL